MIAYLNLFRFVPGYEEQIVNAGKEALLLLFVSFLVAFALTRLYTRLGRARGWGSGSVGGSTCTTWCRESSSSSSPA
jgi:hypothetical protein